MFKSNPLKYMRDLMVKKTFIIIIGFIVIITAIAGSLDYSNPAESVTLGSDYRGNVTKDVYNNEKSETKVAVITGIHPRETLSINTTSDVVKNYAQSHDVEIIHYRIMVKENPDYVRSGRSKGEGLAADYIISDVAKSDYDLVIICHDHKPGYGEGFYIATPLMDAKSVELGEKIDKALPDFRYCPSDANPRKKGSSTEIFTKPLAKTGHPTFVYEIPEWSKYNEAYNMTYTLIDVCYKLL